MPAAPDDAPPPADTTELVPPRSARPDLDAQTPTTSSSDHPEQGAPTRTPAAGAAADGAATTGRTEIGRRAPAESSRTGSAAVALTLLVLVAVLAALVGWMSRRGLDHSDEGYYLSVAAHPLADSADLLQYGRAYHWLFLAVGTDITWFRVTGTLITVLAGAGLTWVALGDPVLRGGRPAPTAAIRLVTSIAVGATGLLGLVQFPLTPSYNTLALQGLLLAATGLLLATRDGRAGAVGWTLVGVAGWVVLLGKPTTAAALAGLVVLVLLLAPGSWRLRAPWAVLGVAVTAVVTLAALGQSPQAFVNGLRTGLAASQALDAHSDLVRLDRVPLVARVWVPVLAVAVGAVVLTWLAGRVTAWVAAPVILVVAAGTVYVTARWWTADPAGLTVRQALAALLLVAAAALVAALAASLVRRRRGTPTDDEPAVPGFPGAPPPTDAARLRLHAVIVAFLLLLPFIYAFGTNQNLWTTSCRALVFWLVVLVAHLTSVQPRLALAPVLAVLVLLTPALAMNIKEPYRYSPLRQATTAARVGPEGGTLLLTPTDASRAQRINALSQRLGIGPTTDILDLTGDSPGYVFRLGGRPVGQAWVIGGYTGSRAATTVLLEANPCSLTDALILRDPTAPRAIDTSVLNEVGLDLERDFHQVGSFERVRIKWRKHPQEDDSTVQLWAPNQGLALPGCTVATR